MVSITIRDVVWVISLVAFGTTGTASAHVIVLVEIRGPTTFQNVPQRVKNMTPSMSKTAMTASAVTEFVFMETLKHAT